MTVNSIAKMVPIKEYRQDKLEKCLFYPENNGWICHSDLFTVSGVLLTLETDLTRKDRMSLTDYINDVKKDKTDSLVEELKKKTSLSKINLCISNKQFLFRKKSRKDYR